MSQRAVDAAVPAPAQSLLDLAGDALCWIDPDGTLHAANATMRGLLSAFERDLGRRMVQLADLPLDGEDREALLLLLESQEPCHECVLRLALPGPPRLLRARLQRNELHGGYLMAISDETTRRMMEVRVLRLERLRLLGALTSGLVHDVNNLLSSILGYAAHLASLARDPDEKAFLDGIRRGAREGATMVHKVEQLVRAPALQRRKVRFQQLVEESLQMFARTATLCGIELSTKIDADLPSVRVVPEDAMQAMLHLLLYVRASVRAGTAVQVHATQERRPASRPDLPPRHEAVLRLVDLGDFGEMEALRALLEHPERGLVEQMGKLSGDSTGLLLALLSLATAGGRIECRGPEQGRRVIELKLPAVSSGART